MLAACGAETLGALLSTTNPLVAPALFGGTRVPKVAVVGGHVAKGLVTSTDRTQPKGIGCGPAAQLPFGNKGMAFPALVLLPMLKKIQSFAEVVLKNSVTGAQASPLALTKSPERPPSQLVPSLIRMPLALKL